LFEVPSFDEVGGCAFLAIKRPQRRPIRALAMSAEEAVSQTFRLSGHLRVTISVSRTHFLCEWDPKMRPLSQQESRAYLRARNLMLQKQADLLGGTVLTIDQTGRPVIHKPSR
jgi:hypothetical protein